MNKLANLLDTRIIVTVFGIIFLMLGINYTKQVEEQHRELYELTVEHYAFEEFHVAMHAGIKTMLANGWDGEKELLLNPWRAVKFYSSQYAAMPMPSFRKGKLGKIAAKSLAAQREEEITDSAAADEFRQISSLGLLKSSDVARYVALMAFKTYCPHCENQLEYMKAKAEEINQQALIQG